MLGWSGKFPDDPKCPKFGTSIVSTAYGAYLDHADAQNLAKPPFMRICREFENWRDLRALSGKFLRQKSCYSESFRFLWLWAVGNASANAQLKLPSVYLSHQEGLRLLDQGSSYPAQDLCSFLRFPIHTPPLPFVKPSFKYWSLFKNVFFWSTAQYSRTISCH